MGPYWGCYLASCRWAAWREGRNWKILLAFALFLGLAIALSLAAATFPVLPFDVKIGQELGKERNPIFASLMQGVSEIGRPEVATPLIVGTAATLALLRRWLEAFFVLATATGVALAILLKVVVARPRPMPDAGNDLLELFNQYGFPSGHVVFFVVFFGFVAYLAYSQLAGPLRWAVVALCGALILLIGPSRVFLGAHWASDVAGGYLIGGLWLFLLILAYRWSVRRFRRAT